MSQFPYLVAVGKDWKIELAEKFLGNKGNKNTLISAWIFWRCFQIAPAVKRCQNSLQYLH